MSISAASVFEIRTTGTDTNGGAFVTGATGVDYSQQAGKRTAPDVTDFSTTDVVGAASTTISSATANFTANIVGNIIYLQGGTAPLTAGWYQVISRTSATQIVLDRSVSAGTGITMNIGGCMLTPGGAALASGGISGVTYYIKSGTYSITTGTQNVANGCINQFGNWIGYDVTRLDYGTPPVLQLNISTTTFIITGNTGIVANIVIDGNSQVNARGLSIAATGITLAYKIEVKGCSVGAFTGGGNGGAFINCTAHNNTVNGFATIATCDVYGCISYSNTGNGFDVTGGAHIYNSIAYSNTGVGFNVTSWGVASNCTSYANGSHGFDNTNGNGRFINCISESNVGAGFRVPATSNYLFCLNCAVFGNTPNISLGTGKLLQTLNLVTGVSSFFVNAAGGNFALNNTASAGAACRAAGFPGVYPPGLTTGYLDIGAAQHQDTGGGGGGAISALYFG